MSRKLKPLFIITILYFILPMINIYLALTAAGCILIPFLLLKRSGRNIWCAYACPRANSLSRLRFLNIGFKTPEWLKGKSMRNNMLIYFGINFSFIALSTIMVSAGRINPIDKIRLLIIFQLPFSLPQLFPPETPAAPVLHLAYRFYSFMLTSTLLGIILAILFKPRTWCAICPVNSISIKMLNNRKEVLNEQTV